MSTPDGFRDDDSSRGCCGCCGGRSKKPKAQPPPEQQAFGSQIGQPMDQQVEQQVEQPKSRSTSSTMSPERKSLRERIPAPYDPMAQLAAGQLGLSKKEQAQVTKALEAEMERRRRWKLLLRAKGLRRTQAKQPKPGDGKVSIEDVLSGDIFGVPSPPEPDRVAASSPDLEAELQKNDNLEEKRKEWIRKMQSGGTTSPKQQQKKKHSLRESPDQPDSLSVDADTAKDIGSHTLMKMLEKVIVDAKEETKKAARKSDKKPNEMKPEELVTFRRKNPKGWDKLSTANSIASFGLAKPTPEDEEKAQRVQKRHKKRRRQIHFDKKVVVASIPAGEDFQQGEQIQYSSGRVSFQPDALKKQ